MEQLNDMSRPAFGYSWAKVPAPGIGDDKDPRVRVCPGCRTTGDPVDVRIIDIPPDHRHRPRCARCGERLGDVPYTYG